MAEATDIIKRIVETGEVSYGSRGVQKLIASGKPKLIIVSSNCPSTVSEDISTSAKIVNVPVFNYIGSSLELGEVCRKPFPISAMAVLKEGKAKLSELRMRGTA